ncbi:MAG: hypothetical protein DRJ01_02490 [Bacteroidetes bacterium]|nr:MAG: hypothetical protein DRJ01_02490 [Bacteroidota bacterium]
MEKLKKQSMLVLIALLGISMFFVSSCNKDDDDDTVNKTALMAKITEANDLYTNAVEGTAAGQYAYGSKAELKSVIDIAQGVYDNEASTQTEVDNSVVSLTNAMDLFETKVIAAIAPDDLVGQWTFDEGTGTTVKDYSGNGFDGTFGNEAGFGTGQPTWTTDRYGNEGKAIAFDEGAKITIPYNTAINPTQITIALWVNAAHVRANNRFMGLQSWNGYKFQLQSANKVFFTASTDSSIYDRDTDPALDTLKWYHIAVTYGGNEMAFYVNGVQTKLWDDVKGDLVKVTGHDLVFGVGSSKFAATTDNYDADHIIPLEWGGYFDGSLDEIRIYKTVLTPTQIASIYNLEKVQN